MSTDARAALDALASLPGVVDLVSGSRSAFETLRWHPALRRRVAETAAEGRIRGAQASAALDGARLPLPQVRELVVGLRPWRPSDPFHRVLRAAATTTDVAAEEGLTAPAQVLARLQTAASGAGPAGAAPGSVGRPRGPADPLPEELRDLGPAPHADEARARLGQVLDLIASGVGPALLVGAVAHAEIALARPFGAGNLLVARAVERQVHRVRGLDPLGVGVPEAGYWQGGIEAYVGALGAYRAGSPQGVGVWLERSGQAALVGATEGQAVADAVLRGSWAEGG